MSEVDGMDAGTDENAHTYEGPSALSRRAFRVQHPSYAVIVRVGLDPHSP
jgi:hypothetical protein